ncbi:AraC family transcriptional regulator [Dysgonomonas sp. 521]|uniref:AraC family transcriptional regulator n=1 Tax=Dysgonomonas sp. 521 TaxID=2302932 RepID=UPI0013D32027|nr:AraC family transcriptional regulator [Dysgonomonas sp. 521]NDV94821.1 AraC family transcriptional regulator [Dysgonomonas sp. 521]
MKDSILREVTPLSQRDCFMIFSRVKKHFTFPLHVHAEFELNFIENGAGAKRVVGDSIEEIDNLELALIAASNLEHGWLDHKCKSDEISEITIQFHGDLFNEQLLQRNQFRSVKEMFEKAAYGVTFAPDTIAQIKEQLYSLASEPEGAHSVLKLFGILYDLSMSPMRELSSRSFNEQEQNYDSRRIERAYNYMLANYSNEVRLSDVANIVGMTEVAFSRFIKQRTGRNFIDSLNDIRLGHATRMLVDTTHSIAEISMICGFNNLSNFNRIFKKKKGCTPREFRENYKETKFFV